jgi:hypothetical protein
VYKKKEEEGRRQANKRRNYIENRVKVLGTYREKFDIRVTAQGRGPEMV